MNKLRKELYDCFYNPPEFPAQKQEIEECHQALIHAPDQFLDLVLDYFLVQLHDFIKYGLLSPFRMVCRDFILPEPASYVFFYALFNLCKLLYLIAKCAGIDVQRRKGAASCTEQRDAKQPRLQSSGLSAPQDAHTPVRRV